MILPIETLLLLLVVILAFVSLWIRDLMSSVVVFGAYSFLMCLIWTGMGAVDVAFTEAAVGAGVSTVFFIAVLLNTTRRIHFNPLDLSSKIMATFLCASVGYFLFLGISDLPQWGNPYAPVNANVSSYYVEHAYEDTKVPNLVTAVLADYRSFDTMFETCVVFIAVLGIYMLLKKEDSETETLHPPDSQSEDSLVIRVASRFMVPFIQLFGFYVVAHGHYSPGGGFQGGVILGASLILLAMGFDMAYVKRLLNMKRMIVLSAVGVLIFAGWGLIPVLLGHHFLDYSAWAKLIPTDAIMARYHSMLAVEVGVALTVMCGMYGIYMSLVSDGKFDKGL